MTTRDFGWINRYGISVYALEKTRCWPATPTLGPCSSSLDSDYVPLELIGDGLLPPTSTARAAQSIATPRQLSARRMMTLPTARPSTL